MTKKTMSKLNLLKFLQNRTYSDKFDTFDVSDENQIRTVSAALKKKLKEEPEIQVIFL
jgi:hypothetical protein